MVRSALEKSLVVAVPPATHDSKVGGNGYLWRTASKMLLSDLALAEENTHLKADEA